MTEPSLNCGAATDTGLVRDRNEDRYWMDPARGALLVVDGVGGQAAGERAAEIAVAAIRAGVGGTDHRLSWSVMPLAARAAIGGTDHRPSWSVMPPTAREAIGGTDHRLSWSVMSPAARVREAIAAANNRIYAAARQNPGLAGMACVLTLALGEGGQVTVRDVGSCPRSADEGDFIEVRQCELPNDAAMLLCSDGLSDHLTSRRIREIAERYAGDAVQTARNLVDAANQAGGRDNITAVFVAGPAFGGSSAATRPRLGITRLRPRRRVWSGRVAFLSYGLLLAVLLWAAL